MSGVLKVIVLFSGRGSNFESLILGSETYKNYVIIDAVTDNPTAHGIEIAKQYSVPCKVFPRENGMSKENFKREIFSYIESKKPDLIALAGFMQLVPNWFTEKWQRKIINIHPSLLPLYPGLETHKRVLEAHESDHGCTVHYVDSGIDTGEIIAQMKCNINEGDTPELLAARVLELEHELYPKVISEIASKKI